MLRPARRLRRWRTPAAVLAALLAAPAVVVGPASAARADAVRQQEQWVLNAIDVAGAWQHTHGSGVTVALIDSGVNGQVTDLSGSVTTGRDFSGVNTPPENANWGVHGTWMASLIAGHGHAPGGSSGIAGVAPAAKILSIRAVTDQGDPGYHRYQHESESRVQGHLADAIRYATSKRVSVISMSLGYQGASLPVRSAIAAALAKGIVVVASSGNSGGASSGQHGNAPYSFPADYPGVLGVGATSQSGVPAGFSSANLSVQVAAPGVRVPAQGRDGQYWLVSGTSPACALTAGVAALIKSVYPRLAPAGVVQAITASTTNKPHDGYVAQVGFGTVDATAALKMAGRLARDQGLGRGLVAAAQFGGGPAAIPAVPVTPRDRQQLLVDSLAALGCLVVVLVLVFRLIVTRRPAVVGAHAGWSPGAGPGPGWGAGSRATAGSGAPAGWGSGSGVPAGRAGGTALASGPAGAGLGGAGAGGTWPGGGEGGYGRSAGYWASGGYKPPGGLRPPMRLQQPADPGPPADAVPLSGAMPPVGYQGPADSVPPPDVVPPVGYREPADSAPPSSTTPPSGYRGPAGSMRPAGYGAPGAYQQRAGFLPPVEPGPPTGYQAPGFGAPAGHPGYGAPREAGPPDSNGQAAGYPPPAEPGPPTGYQAPGFGAPAGHPGYGAPREAGPPDSNGPAAGYLPPPVSPEPPVSPQPPASFEPPADTGSAPAGYRPATGYQPLSWPAGGPVAPAGHSADADTGPLAGNPEPTEPQGLPGGRADDLPPADDDTWPSSSPW